MTTDAANVIQYDRVMTTKLAIAYGAALEVLHRTGVQPGANALDLACGPGHFSLCLAKYLEVGRLVGLDLSPGMVDVANKNAAAAGLADRATFRPCDVTHLEGIGNAELDAATFTDAAHHMPDLETVTRVMTEMSRVTRPDGLIMVMDLVRLKTAELTEEYVQTLGHDYVERGLPAFYDDFRNSMYAAWTADELHQAIPRDTQRWWCHLVPRGLPTIQFILGLPVGRKQLFVRSGFPWKPEDNPVPKEMRTEWRLLRWSLRFAKKRWLPPAA